MGDMLVSSRLYTRIVNRYTFTMKLSAIILSKGEATTQKAIDSVSFMDEILVVLDSDLNSEIGGPNVKVLKHELAGDYQQRNSQQLRQKGTGYLLDSDEMLTGVIGRG